MNAYSVLADIVVVVHLAYVLFVIVGLLLVLVGYLCRWQWVHNAWFRLVHAAMIGVVVIESLLSITCPLTTWEHSLRLEAGESPSQQSFVGRLAHDLLFIELPEDSFTVLYCLFGGLVLLTFWLVPVRLKVRSVPPGNAGTS